jgi:hypothetical protein
MTTVILGAVAVGFLTLYLMRRAARLRAEEDNF